MTSLSPPQRSEDCSSLQHTPTLADGYTNRVRIPFQNEGCFKKKSLCYLQRAEPQPDRVCRRTGSVGGQLSALLAEGQARLPSTQPHLRELRQAPRAPPRHPRSHLPPTQEVGAKEADTSQPSPTPSGRCPLNSAAALEFIYLKERMMAAARS